MSHYANRAGVGRDRSSVVVLLSPNVRGVGRCICVPVYQHIVVTPDAVCVCSDLNDRRIIESPPANY